jgi:arginyl-tRNA synthetase
MAIAPLCLDSAFMLIHYPSLKQRFANLLMDAVMLISDLPCHRAAAEKKVAQGSIPLQLDARSPLGTFTSAIALQLAGRQHPPMEIAEHLLSLVRPSSDLKLWVKPPGWIYGQFSTGAIALLLQQLTEQSPHLQPAQPITLDQSLRDPVLFPAQYAHARCCSLLCLAQREGLIDLEFNSQEPSFTLPASIPWYTEQKQLRLQHPSEHKLIEQLLEFPGLLNNPKQMQPTQAIAVAIPWPLDHQKLIQQTQAWGKSLLQFYRDCRILGTISQATPELSQARLGLVSITQRALAFLLQDLLHVIAPPEL